MTYAGLTMSILVAIILTVTILFSIGHKSNRENEAENALGVAIENTLENLMRDKTYEISEKDEFVADFLEDFILQIDSYSDIEVTCKAVDTQKGLFSVEVNLSFLYNNGNKGQVTSERTVIFETVNQSNLESNKTTEKTYTLEYYIKNDAGEYELYKTLQLSQGTKIPLIVPPDTPLLQFSKWTYFQNGKFITLKQQTVTNHIKLYAQYINKDLDY